MRTIVLPILALLLASVLVPAPAAAVVCVPTTQICPDEIVDEVQQIVEDLVESVRDTRVSPTVERHADNSYTIGVERCDEWGCEQSDVYRTPPLPTNAGVRANPDGSVSVYVVECNSMGVCAPRNVYTSPRLPQQPGARANEDGSFTVHYTQCDANGCSERGVTTIPVRTCYTYEPNAITNACITSGVDSETVAHPTVEQTQRTTCPVGSETCTTHAWVAVDDGSTTVPVPVVGGYVEATILCGFNAPCRVTLP